MITTIGHRFGHQSGLDEGSGQTSAAILNVFVFRVYLFFSTIIKALNIVNCSIFADMATFQQKQWYDKKKWPTRCTGLSPACLKPVKQNVQHMKRPICIKNFYIR